MRLVRDKKLEVRIHSVNSSKSYSNLAFCPIANPIFGGKYLKGRCFPEKTDRYKFCHEIRFDKSEALSA